MKSEKKWEKVDHVANIPTPSDWALGHRIGGEEKGEPQARDQLEVFNRTRLDWTFLDT